MVTVLTELGASNVSASNVEGENLWLKAADVEAAIGWTLKPQGLCQGEVCVPLPHSNTDNFVNGDDVNVAEWWRLMDRPVLHDNAGATWMLGAGANQRAEVLNTLEAPDFTLPDLDGKMHSLSDYRGKRVFLTTWSSW
ncbi:MAG: hypothetical protein ACI9BW_000903 [Gammaproteobacteria bacterium]|jgi:hypothetical protein